MSFRCRSCIVALIVFGSVGVASAQDQVELSIFVGYRDGGKVRVRATDENLAFDGAETFGFHFDGLGLTYFDPKERGLSSDSRFSFSGAAGVRFRFGDHVGIRLEARGFGTFVSSSGAIWCGGGSGFRG